MIGRRGSFALVAAALAAPALPRAAGAQQPAGGPPGTPAVHALLVGINSYRIEPLRGCINDLQILERAIRPRAASVTTLTERAATRAGFLRAWRETAARCAPGDWLFLSFSGHGARKPEAIRGSEADGMDDFLVFQPFHPVDGAREILLDNEIETMLAELGRRGVTVLFVADCCHAGTMTRSVHPAAAGQQQLRTLDGMFSVTTLVESLAAAPPPPPSPPPAALSHVHLFAGSVEELPVPEISYAGRRHGALSVMMARALAAGGQPSLRDLADQVVRGVRTLGDGRQNAEVTLGTAPDRPLFGPLRAAPVAATAATAPMTTAPATTAPARPTSAAPAPASLAPSRETADPPVRLRVDGRPDATAIAAVERLAQVQRVAAGEEADLIWHAGSRQTISALGDLLATEVGPERLAASVARLRAVRRLQALALERPPELRLERRDGETGGMSRSAALRYHNDAHPAGAKLTLTIARLRHPFLVLFGLAGDGTVQFLYPGEGETSRVDPTEPFVVADIEVKEPFGSDHVVVVATDRVQTALVATLNRLNERRDPAGALAAVERALTGGWQVGLLGIFTRPG